MSEEEESQELVKADAAAELEMLGGQERGVGGRLWSGFVKTKEHRRFVEFCEACRRSRRIGICYGVSGVGKTQSARQYTQWDEIEPLLSWHGVVQPRLSADNPRPSAAFYAPTATVTARQMEKDLALLRWSLRVVGEAASSVPQAVETVEGMVRPGKIDLLIIDEADRLKSLALEVLRDIYDRNAMGLILLGLPGIERRIAAYYPQVQSRVGFVHQYRALDRQEQSELIQKEIRTLKSGGEGKIEKDAIALIIRLTGGKFRQMESLLEEIYRIMQINEDVDVVSKEVVEAAREQLA